MRIAVLSDIHGNLSALEAVLEHAERQRPDVIVAAGDVVVGGPDSAACWRLLRDRELVTVRGNHERYLVAAADGDPAYAGPNWAPLRWASARFESAEITEIRALPMTLRVAGADDLLVTHASPRDDYDHLAPSTPDREVLEKFGGMPERTVVRGHNHLAFERRAGGLRVIAIGSVGIPLDGHPMAQYALLERTPEAWKVSHQRISYDVDAAVRAFRASGYLEEAGPIARLFLREIATATHQLVPFMRHYRRWQEDDPAIGLEEAVDRFLNIY